MAGFWRTDFDDNGVSAIMMPALLADACSYEGAQPAPPRFQPLLSAAKPGLGGSDMAGDTCPVRALIDGEWQDAVGSCKLQDITGPG